jgi:hypothetical protein
MDIQVRGETKAFGMSGRRAGDPDSLTSLDCMAGVLEQKEEEWARSHIFLQLCY